MNKKILSLAFISAAFLFGCSADGGFDSNHNPPEWDHKPNIDIDAPSNTPSGSSGKYCSWSAMGTTYCEAINSSFTEDDCEDDYGTVLNSDSSCDIID